MRLNYAQEWFKATYVAALQRIARGTVGYTKHVRGDTWQFAWVDAHGIPRSVPVYRTEIDILPFLRLPIR